MWLSSMKPFPVHYFCNFLSCTKSPQLNLIEILWRFMEYEWMELNADKTLVSYVEKVLRDFGSNYVIYFA